MATNNHRFNLSDDDENFICFLNSITEELKEESAKKSDRYGLNFSDSEDDFYYDDRAVRAERRIDILKVNSLSLHDILKKGPPACRN